MLRFLFYIYFRILSMLIPTITHCSTKKSGLFLLTTYCYFHCSKALLEGSEAEILFIKRSVNPRDRWSGHVAFPGGRQEGDESLRHTSARETMEEVGLDVESRDYVYLGSLDDRYTMPINIRPFLISTHGAYCASSALQ